MAQRFDRVQADLGIDETVEGHAVGIGLPPGERLASLPFADDRLDHAMMPKVVQAFGQRDRLRVLEAVVNNEMRVGAPDGYRSSHTEQSSMASLGRVGQAA